MEHDDFKMFLKQDIVAQFMSIFGGVFFLQFPGISAFDSENDGCFRLGSYNDTLDLIRMSLENGENLLIKSLKRSRGEGVYSSEQP